MIQQRLGESDKDYEARKKRIRRTRQGVDFGLAHAGGGGGGGGASGPIPNGCVTQGSNGTEYGYDSSIPIGANTPDTIAATGQFVYANYWMADGTFIMQFGDAGNEQIPDVEFIFTVINGTLLQYVWDGVRYQASNPTLATQLISDYVLDEDVCYTALPILKKMISYDMNITDVEGTNTLINNTSYAPHFNAPVINATQNGPGSILVDGSTDIITGFKPNISQYSIEETITGELQDFGSEEIVNGTFDTNIDGWEIIENATVSWDVSERLLLDITGSGGGVTTTDALPDWKEYATYHITADVEIGTFNGTALNIKAGSHTVVAGYDISSGKIDIIYYRDSTSTTNQLSFTRNSANIGTIYFDNVSVKELTTSQRTEKRLLTHTDNHLGSDISDTSFRVSDGRLTSYSFNAGDNHATLEDDSGTTDGYLILRFTVNIGSTYLVTMNTDIVNTPSSDTYRPVLDDNQGTSNIFSGAGTLNTMSCEITAVETIIRLSLFANDVTVTYENIVVKELTTQNKYYINGIEQATPSLPDPDTIINLGDTAVIGYPDTIQSREAYFNVHTEVIEPTFVTTGPNLYPNWELINGSHINQDIPTGTLPDGHTLAFNTGDPCNATYNDNGDGSFSYLFNQVQDHARLVLQQTIGYGVFEVGKRYRYQAKVRTVTFNPIATQLRAIHIAAAVDLVIIDADNAMIDEEVGYELKWIDFEVTDSGISRANFRHGCGVWDVLTTAQETIELAIYELTTV